MQQKAQQSSVTNSQTTVCKCKMLIVILDNRTAVFGMIHALLKYCVLLIRYYKSSH